MNDKGLEVIDNRDMVDTREIRPTMLITQMALKVRSVDR